MRNFLRMDNYRQVNELAKFIFQNVRALQFWWMQSFNRCRKLSEACVVYNSLVNLFILKHVAPLSTETLFLMILIEYNFLICTCPRFPAWKDQLVLCIKLLPCTAKVFTLAVQGSSSSNISTNQTKNRN